MTRQKKICVFPIDPNIFYAIKKKKKEEEIGKIRKSVSVSDFTTTIFFISLYIWSMFGTKNIVLHVK